jgi:pilus assembly protein TadC
MIKHKKNNAKKFLKRSGKFRKKQKPGFFSSFFGKRTAKKKEKAVKSKQKKVDKAPPENISKVQKPGFFSSFLGKRDTKKEEKVIGGEQKKVDNSPIKEVVNVQKPGLNFLSLFRKKSAAVKEETSVPIKQKDASTVPDQSNVQKPKFSLLHLFRKKTSEKAVQSEQKNVDNALSDINQIQKPKFNVLSFFKKKTAMKKGNSFTPNSLTKEKRKRALVQERKHRFREHLEKAGIETEPGLITKRIYNIVIILALIISAFLIYYAWANLHVPWQTLLIYLVVVWLLVFVVILFLIWAVFYLVIDLIILKRKMEIEEVLADYLQLTASNIKAGMTIDRALWYAVRPRFGVLANEIERVAKETMKGDDLKVALQRFSAKYDSVMLKRSINLLIEGIDAGGEIGDLLNKIAVNIQENKIIKKEMSANITTYIIFIAVATIGAAPVLFALAGTLIKVISSLTVNMSSSSSAGVGGLSFSGTGIKYSDFRIFAITCLVITSFFSAAIESSIKSGNVKMGFKYVPIFIIFSVTLFFIADWVLGQLIGSLL